MNSQVPEHVGGKLGYYAFAAETAITAGTWDATLGAASLARTAQRAVTAGAPTAFALCRPPGHHAAADYFGGYCFKQRCSRRPWVPKRWGGTCGDSRCRLSSRQRHARHLL